MLFQRVLKIVLPLLQPSIIRWAKQLSQDVLATGLPLDEAGIATARRVGVTQPEKIRLRYVQELPLPTHFFLRLAARKTGMMNARTVGFTLGHAVLMIEGKDTERLRLHEFRHVYQYERAGSIEAFLPGYLQQIVTYGYRQAPFEKDAVAQEQNV